MWISTFQAVGHSPSLDRMPEWFVELYVPASEPEPETLARLARDGADNVTRYLGSIFLPGEETCFHRYESKDSESLCRALERGGVRYERVIEAVALP
jgi:hypothetical protein